MPTSGRALDGMALSATSHRLTGCAIGEVLGIVIGTALGFSDWGTIALGDRAGLPCSVTRSPACRCCGPGCALVGRVVPIALASDTLSIATMEVVDNLILLVIPGAMDAGVGDLLFWGSAGGGPGASPGSSPSRSTAACSPAARATRPCTRPASTAARPPPLVGAVAASAPAAVFGTAVLLAELL